MKSTKIQFATIFILASLLLVSLVLLGGCKKKTKPAGTIETEEAASMMTEQTTCPVMGGAINKNIFTEYKGKKVYFCCPSCKEAFEKEPEKYLSNLPQFSD
jgi:YHS domain-containing protein